jgi:flavin reductase (DIM6/NTAB) family NADH-FMN oxidoreductase RutF
MAINKKRFSADCFIARRSFVLSVPVKGQEKLVASIGSCSGYKSDKFAAIDGLVAVGI